MIENGYVLLTNDSFDNGKLISDLKYQWKMNVEGAEEIQASFTFSVGDFFCSIAVMPAPIPNDEAEHRATGNYYCRDAVDIAKAHKAHLMVTIMDQGSSTNVECMKLYSKIIASCLSQSNASGVYTSGTVFSADFYQKCAKQYLRGDDIPLMIWVFIGVGQNEQGNQLYTVGMEKFKKNEMEINNSAVETGTLHASLSSICSYVISADLVLQDGETLGFSAEQQWAITRSKSLYSPSEFSLKLQITDVDHASPKQSSSTRINTQNNAENRATEEVDEKQNGTKKSLIIVVALVILAFISMAFFA